VNNEHFQYEDVITHNFCTTAGIFVSHFVFECMLYITEYWYDLVSSVCTVLVAVPEELSTPTEVKDHQRVTNILSQDVVLLDRGSDFGQCVSDSGISDKQSSDVMRHLGVKCFPTSSVISSDSSASQSSTQNVDHRDASAAHFQPNETSSATELKLPRHATTRRARLSRKSTKRVRQRIPETNIEEFDDDSFMDTNDEEEVEFSETDSEPNEDEHAISSDESDLAFETELAVQMNISQVNC